MRLNFNIDDELKDKLTSKAQKLHISRSSYICYCISKQMQMDYMLENLPVVISAVEKMNSTHGDNSFFEIKNKNSF